MPEEPLILKILSEGLFRDGGYGHVYRVNLNTGSIGDTSSVNSRSKDPDHISRRVPQGNSLGSVMSTGHIVQANYNHARGYGNFIKDNKNIDTIEKSGSLKKHMTEANLSGKFSKTGKDIDGRDLGQISMGTRDTVDILLKDHTDDMNFKGPFDINKKDINGRDLGPEEMGNRDTTNHIIQANYNYAKNYSAFKKDDKNTDTIETSGTLKKHMDEVNIKGPSTKTGKDINGRDLPTHNLGNRIPIKNEGDDYVKDRFLTISSSNNRDTDPNGNSLEDFKGPYTNTGKDINGRDLLEADSLSIRFDNEPDNFNIGNNLFAVIEDPSDTTNKGNDLKIRFDNEPPETNTGNDLKIRFDNEPLEVNTGNDLKNRFDNEPQEVNTGNDLKNRFDNEPKEVNTGNDLKSRFDNEPKEVNTGNDLKSRFNNEPPEINTGNDLSIRFDNEPKEVNTGNDLKSIPQEDKTNIEEVLKPLFDNEPKEVNTGNDLSSRFNNVQNERNIGTNLGQLYTNKTRINVDLGNIYQ